MTPEEEFRLLRKTSQEITAAVDNAYNELMRLISGGAPPRDAVEQVMDEFTGVYTEIMKAGLGVVIGESIGEAMSIQVGEILLSTKLYSKTAETSTIVETIVRKHAQGFNDARQLALDLYEGYDFNPEEVLNLKPTNNALPEHLRSLLKDTKTQKTIDTSFARAKTKALRTGALRASYNDLITAIDNIESGIGQDALAKKLDVAFNEKMRYYAKRIAQTELHRAYAETQAREIMDDEAVEFVQWRLNPSHPVHDICDYFAGANRYGLGPGIYPKAFAPVAPAHPFCRCVLSKVFDVDGVPVNNPDADITYFRKLPLDTQRRVAGSKKKLGQIMDGDDAWSVHNTSSPAIYQVKMAGDIS